MSELALELVRRQRAGGRDILLRYPINTTMPLPLGHVEAGLHLVYGTLDGRGADTPQRTPRFWWAATVERRRAARGECLTGVSFLFALGRKIGRPRKKFFVCSRCGTYIRTHPDPDGNIIRRHQVGSKRPSSSNTRNQNVFETSACESGTLHQRRSDEVPCCGWRHSRGAQGSEMYAMFHLRKDEQTSQPQAISYPDQRRTFQ